MRSLPFLPISLAVAAVLLLAGCGESPRTLGKVDRTPVTLRIGGATTVMIPVQEVADAFSREHPRIHFDHTESSVTNGIHELCDEQIQIARISRDLTEDDFRVAASKQVSMGIHPIGYDAVAIIAHPSRVEALESISFEELRNIYFGSDKNLNWNSLGLGDAPIKPVAFTSGDPDGPDVTFRDKVTGAGTTGWSDQVQQVDSEREVVGRVSMDPDCIGFCSRSHVNTTVGVVPIRLTDGSISKLTDDAVISRRYPLLRTTALVARQPLSDEVRDFILFCYEPTSRMLIRHEGLLPINH